MAIAARAPVAFVSSEASADMVYPVARLAMLRAEAQETVRLGNLLDRSVHVASALVLMGVAALAFGGAGIAESGTWAVFVLAAAGALVAAYRRTTGLPFEIAPLKSFSQDLHALLVFAGSVWGAGAFLALSSSTTTISIVLFSAGASAVIALLLRDRQSAFLFLAPVAALCSFAYVLRPLGDGLFGSALNLIACGLLATAMMIRARTSAYDTEISELIGLPQS